MFQNRQFIQDFYVIGLSYKKADAILRGQFSLTPAQYDRLLADAPDYGVQEVFVISTCNRTEIYGFGYCVHQLIELLCKYVPGSSRTFREHAYVKRNEEAVRHLFEVAAGLDSQILGDYEIIGQIKQAVAFSRERGFLGAYTERLVNTALAASKDVKNQTSLSNGTVSVAFSTVQYLLGQTGDLASRRVLVVGAGKMGANVCKNLLTYAPAGNITILNRTQAKADALAADLGILSAPAATLEEQIALNDIIVLATSSSQPILHPGQLAGAGEKTIVDLAVPANVEPAVPFLENVIFANVDELSKAVDATLEQRIAEIPKANRVIDKHFADFQDWNEKRKHAPFLKTMKKTLQQIHTSSYIQQEAIAGGYSDANQRIQQVVRHYARKVTQDPRYGCHCLEAINQYIH